MEFKDWLIQTKTDNPEIEDFIGKIALYFIESGFNASEFEKRVANGIANIDKQIDTSLIKVEDAKN